MAATNPQVAPAHVFAPGASAPPTRRKGESRSWLWSLIIGLLILGAMGTVPQQNDPSELYNWTFVVLFCCLAQSWNLIGGFVGYAAFGNVVFFGIGAYAVPLAVQHNLPFWAGLLLGAVAAGLLAFLLGLPVLRLKGHYFAIATLGVAVGLGQFFFAEAIGGSADVIQAPTPSFGDLDPSTIFFYGFLALSLLLLLGTTWLTRTRFGYALVAIRENEQAAEALGIPTLWYKVAAFVLSATPTALAGSLFALWQATFTPLGDGGVFDPTFSVAMVLMTFLGGAGTILGPLIGGVIIQYLRNYTFLNFNAIYGPLLGILIILVTIFLPQGLIRLVQELTRAPVAAEGPEAARVSYIHRIGAGLRRVVRFISSQGV